MKNFVAITLFAALFLCSYAADQETIVLFRTFHANNICEDKKGETVDWNGTKSPTPFPNERRLTQMFHDVTGDCVSHNDYIFSKEECTENGWTMHLCWDKDCNDCAAKTFGWDDCIGDRTQAICTSRDRVSEWVDLNQNVIRLSMHHYDGDDVKCDDSNLDTWGYFRPNTCETLMGSYFKILREEGAKDAKIQFFEDGECKEPLKFEDVDTFPLPTDKCLRSIFVDSKKAIQITLDAREGS